jgi:hypothetical protein
MVTEALNCLFRPKQRFLGLHDFECGGTMVLQNVGNSAILYNITSHRTWKKYQYALNRRMGVSWSQSGWFRNDKNLFSVLGVEP